MKSAAVILSSLASLAAAICDHGTTFYPRAVDTVPVATFGFNDVTGPLNWHGLKKENEACALGKAQSPINVDTSVIKAVSGKTLGFNVDAYPHGAEFENLGSTVEVIANGTLLREGKKYALKQFHFHTPSEHRIDSEYYPMEVHFVFQADGERALSTPHEFYHRQIMTNKLPPF
jgi:carbonic anhydrase